MNKHAIPGVCRQCHHPASDGLLCRVHGRAKRATQAKYRASVTARRRAARAAVRGTL